VLSLSLSLSLSLIIMRRRLLAMLGISESISLRVRAKRLWCLRVFILHSARSASNCLQPPPLPHPSLSSMSAQVRCPVSCFFAPSDVGLRAARGAARRGPGRGNVAAVGSRGRRDESAGALVGQHLLHGNLPVAVGVPCGLRRTRQKPGGRESDEGRMKRGEGGGEEGGRDRGEEAVATQSTWYQKKRTSASARGNVTNALV